MGIAWARGLMEDVDKLNQIAKERTRRPDERIIRAAIKLSEQIKSWDRQTRELIDALDKRVSGDVGDFLIEVDKAMK
jgi:hypothetical protein